MNNSIYIRRKKKIYIEKGDNLLPKEYISTLLVNLESFGYTLSPELIQAISTLSTEKLSKFYKQLIADIKENVGANFVYKTVYPNFPEQVMNANQAELYYNAVMHYFGDWIEKRMFPEYEKKERKKLEDTINLKIIDLGTKEDFNLIFTRLLHSKTSISEADKHDITWYVKNCGNAIEKLIPNQIPFKENVALISASLIEYTTIAEKILSKHIHTATDILRIAIALSNGDISLATNTKFKSFSKKERRLLMELLENCNSITEDMLRFKNKWKRLGERLHPFEYKKMFPKCFEAFDIIRNDKPFQSFNAKIEQGLLQKNIEEVITLLKTRPGEFARRLDKLVRLSTNPAIINSFKDIADNISSPVLLQLYTHFKNRNNQNELRTFFPKGNVGKAKAIKNILPKIDPTICEEIVSIAENALIKKFGQYKSLGKVYLDEELKNYTVPFSLRSASKALKTIARGSKINLPLGNTVRFFIYWKDGSSRTDLDLSAVALDFNSNYKNVIAYYNLKDFGGYHSGDITSAPDGASEFIDIDIVKFLKSDIRFVLMSINSYTNQPYCDLPQCYAGFMIRQFPNSGEIYEPSTVENKFDLTANTRVAIPLIIDLLERKVIWTDISLTSNPSGANNVENNLSAITIINKSMTTLVKPSLHDLFKIHIKARGTKTNDINNATTIFAKDKGITPFDTEQIIAEFL